MRMASETGAQRPLMKGRRKGVTQKECRSHCDSRRALILSGAGGGSFLRSFGLGRKLGKTAGERERERDAGGRLLVLGVSCSSADWKERRNGSFKVREGWEDRGKKEGRCWKASGVRVLYSF